MAFSYSIHISRQTCERISQSIFRKASWIKMRYLRASSRDGNLYSPTIPFVTILVCTVKMKRFLHFMSSMWEDITKHFQKSFMTKNRYSQASCREHNMYNTTNVFATILVCTVKVECCCVSRGRTPYGMLSVWFMLVVCYKRVQWGIQL